MQKQAIFSMVFFNYGIDSAGKNSLTVSPLLWLFPTLTVPLTIIVFMVYRYWRKRREKKVRSKSRESSNVDLERGERKITTHLREA
jgi:cytochrome c-type biogenesis protein CcmH/NrfF